jgi:ribonuclease P protein component
MLSKKYRLTKTEIPEIAKMGKKFHTPNLKISVWYDDALKHSLFAIAVSKKIDKSAVKRNRIKRIIRAALYQLEVNESVLKKAKYVITVIKPDILKLKSTDIVSELKTALHIN